MARVVSLLLVAVAACGQRTIRSGPEVGTPSQVHLWKIDLEDTSNSSVIYARNDGTTPVVISELRLHTCTNLFQSCGTHYPNVRVEPGKTVTVARLDPSNHNRRPNFGWEYRWRGVGASASPQVTSAVPAGAVQARMVPVEALVPLVAIEQGEGVCGMGQGERGYSMRWPTSGPARRVVNVQVDAAGNPVRYSDSRGDLRVAPPGMTPAQAVSDPGDRVNITIDIANGAVLLMNQPVGAPVEHLMARGGTSLLDAPNLGAPRAVIREIMERCGQ